MGVEVGGGLGFVGRVLCYFLYFSLRYRKYGYSRKSKVVIFIK